MATNIQPRDPTDVAWQRWAGEHVDVLGNSLPPQRVLLEALIRFLAAIEGHPIVSRMGAFFLLHAHMGLTAAQVGAALGRTDRAMRTVQALSAQELLDSVWRELGRHRTPKLLPEHAGPVAKYLAEHPHCTMAEVIGFIRDAFNISVERHALRRFSTMYNLGVFRGGSDVPEEESERPFRWAAPTSEAPSSCFPSPSG